MTALEIITLGVCGGVLLVDYVRNRRRFNRTVKQTNADSTIIDRTFTTTQAMTHAVEELGVEVFQLRGDVAKALEALPKKRTRKPKADAAPVTP